MPLDHPEVKACFWNRASVDRATQVDLLRLLKLVAVHYATAVLSLRY